MRIWIDTDIGSDVDDALALAYVLRHPQLELAGVSTVFGDVALRTRIASALLELAGSSGVPVVTGLGGPLTPRRKGVMFGHEGKGIVEGAAPTLRVEQEPDAESRIDGLAQALNRAAPDALLAIGPLSNLGGLARANVSLPPLAIMGGKLSDVMLDGMVPRISEWNWFCDPDAVRAVLAANHETLPRVVPAEVTFRTKLNEADIDRFDHGDGLAQMCGTLSRVWLEAQVELLGSKKPLVRLHDPLTAAILVEPSLCDFESRAVRADDSGAGHPADGTHNVDAAVDVDAEAAREHLMSVWLSEN